MPDEVRDWEIAEAFGWPKTVADEQPAVWLDRMLELHRASVRVEQAKADAERRQGR